MDACLDQLGALSVSYETRKDLVDFASEAASVHPESTNPAQDVRRRILAVLQMAASTHEFQRA